MAICVITRNKYRTMYTIKSTYFIISFQHMSHKKVETCSLLQIKSERSKYLALFHLGFTKKGHRYRRQGKVMFSDASVSHSVQGRGGFCLWVVCLWGVCLQGVVHPWGVCPIPHAGSHCSGWYTSYWNAFLFYIT